MSSKKMTKMQSAPAKQTKMVKVTNGSGLPHLVSDCLLKGAQVGPASVNAYPAIKIGKASRCANPEQTTDKHAAKKATLKAFRLTYENAHKPKNN